MAGQELSFLSHSDMLPRAPGSRSSLTFPSAEPSCCEITVCESEGLWVMQAKYNDGQAGRCTINLSFRTKADNPLNTRAVCSLTNGQHGPKVTGGLI